MPLQYTLYTVVLLFAAGITSVIAVYTAVWGRRNGFDLVVISFLAYMIGATFYGGFRGIMLAFTTVELKTVALAFNQAGWATFTVAWPVFALAYAGQGRYLTRRTLAVFVGVPALLLLGMLTNPLHGQFWTAELATYDGLDVLVRDFVPAYAVVFVYSFGIYFLGLFLLARKALVSDDLYRGQAALVLIGALVPTGVAVATVVLTATGWSPFGSAWLDFGPAGFTVSGLCFAYAIFRYRFLDLGPIAREAVVENMRDGYVVVDARNRIVDCNPAARRLATDPAETIGRPLADALPGCADVLGTHEHDDPIEESITIEVDGSPRHYEVRVSSLFDDGELLGRLLVLQDVTDRHAVRRRYQALIEHSSDMVAILDRDGVIQYQSPSIERVLGFHPEDVIGTNVFDLLHPEDESTARQEFQRCLDDPSYVSRCEYRVRDAEDDWHVLEAVGRNLLDVEPVSGIVINTRDVTDRKRKERELRRTNDRLEEFASVVTHDLRNPLTIAKGHLEHGRETGDLDTIEEAMAALDRMEAIIEDVLTLAQQGRTIGETEQVAIDRIARRARFNVDEEALVIEGSPVVDGDPDRLLHLFENLYRNSVEHGGPDVIIRIGETDEGFYVADDGPGIPPDERDRVFEFGYTNSEDGTGLGLAIVKRIAEAHGWRYSVIESEAGGARFEFSTAEPLTDRNVFTGRPEL